MKRFFVFLAVLLFFIGQAWAGVVKSVSGDAMVDLGKGWVPVKVGMKIPSGADLMTGFDSKIVVAYGAGEFTVDELSQVTFKEKSSQTRVDNNLELKLGKVRVKYEKLKSRKKTSFKVSTPRGSASVRGTEEEVFYFPDSGMRVRVLIGHVDVRSSTGMQVAVRQGGEANTHQGLRISGSADGVRNQIRGSIPGARRRGLSVQEINSVIHEVLQGGIRVRIPDLQNEPERL